MANTMTAGKSGIDAVFDRLPQHVRESFTEEQRAALGEALSQAAGQSRWAGPPINLRFSIPTLLGRYYFVLAAGPERRPKDRRSEDRQRNPLRTLRNLVFIGAASVVMLYLGSMIGLALYIWYLSMVG